MLSYETSVSPCSHCTPIDHACLFGANSVSPPGELKVLETGSDVYDSLDRAVDSLTRKLKKLEKPLPNKTDYSVKRS